MLTSILMFLQLYIYIKIKIIFLITMKFKLKILLIYFFRFKYKLFQQKKNRCSMSCHTTYTQSRFKRFADGATAQSAKFWGFAKF
jgi:hypothetical protein